ncbi:MAG: hypothetical protein RTU92_10885 [Candidatus Thorarchaeota archaeon]
MVIARYRDRSGGIVEAIQFNRTNWKKLRHFTGDRAHKMVTPACQNKRAHCLLKMGEEAAYGVSVKEGDWITKDKDDFYVYSAHEFLKIYKPVQDG